MKIFRRKRSERNELAEMIMSLDKLVDDFITSNPEKEGVIYVFTNLGSHPREKMWELIQLPEFSATDIYPLLSNPPQAYEEKLWGKFCGAEATPDDFFCVAFFNPKYRKQAVEKLLSMVKDGQVSFPRAKSYIGQLLRIPELCGEIWKTYREMNLSRGDLEGVIGDKEVASIIVKNQARDMLKETKTQSKRKKKELKSITKMHEEIERINKLTEELKNEQKKG